MTEDRLSKLEEAEELAIGLLETAGRILSELKEIHYTGEDKNRNLIEGTKEYFEKLGAIKTILNQEIESLKQSTPGTTRRPGVDKLAIAEWEAKVFADNLHELLTTT